MNRNGRKPHTKSFGVVVHDAANTEVCPRCNGSGLVSLEGITIGDRFLACRHKLKKTQAQVSPLLGISRAQLANLEGDRSRPGIEMLVKAADAFGVSIDYLLGRK
jgi:DNA-binding XRE family transcriptional regulator